MNERLKEVRKALGMTQQQFADNISLKRQTVAAYEIGKISPSDSTVSYMCDKFSINENWLRTGSGDMFIPQSRDEMISVFIGKIQNLNDDNFKKRFVSMLSRLDESEWEVLEKMAKKMAEK